MKKYDKIIGQKFGMLTIKSFSERVPFPSGGAAYKYVCECDCGKRITVAISSLRSGHTKSCGCYKIELLQLRTIHGLIDHPLYWVWHSMKNRCYKEDDPAYHNYGGRGIKVCDEWFVFDNFYNWCIRNGWKKSLELDRFPNVNGDYCPSNCRFATRKQNQNNKRNNVRAIYKGEMLTISEISDKSGVPYGTVYYRVKTRQSKGIQIP